MPTLLKVIISFCAEIFIIVIGGVTGAWPPARNIPAGAGGPGDGFAVVLCGEAGMIVAGMVGIVGLVIFWSVSAMRSEVADRKTGEMKPVIPQAEGVWPPPPNR